MEHKVGEIVSVWWDKELGRQHGIIDKVWDGWVWVTHAATVRGKLSMRRDYFSPTQLRPIKRPQLIKDVMAKEWYLAERERLTKEDASRAVDVHRHSQC